MRLNLVVFCVIVLCALPSEGRKKHRKIRSHHHTHGQRNHPRIWALLVAGSSGWYNYRHQADICHAYHILHSHGIPDSRIVTMMYDDIAENEQNPFPGEIFNRPNGSDVYAGVVKDYVGEDVTPDNFLKILQGKKEEMAGIGSGKVIESNADDHVFVYFADHGATGLVAFPAGGYLNAKPLNDALVSMNQRKRFSKLVFYMEACESGSMFYKLLSKNISVYALTASNAHESSWGCYCDNPKHLPCLGDLFSVNWMEDSDREDIERETLEQQYDVTRRETNRSHVMHYGDLSFLQHHVGEYQGYGSARRHHLPRLPKKPVDARHVPLFYLQQRVKWASNHYEKRRALQQLREMTLRRTYVEDVMKNIVELLVLEESDQELMFSTHAILSDYACHETVTSALHNHCFNFNQNPYVLKYVYVLVNMCEYGAPPSTIAAAIRVACESAIEFDGGVH